VSDTTTLVLRPNCRATSVAAMSFFSVVSTRTRGPTRGELPTSPAVKPRWAAACSVSSARPDGCRR
jgi:hypothetical protein